MRLSGREPAGAGASGKLGAGERVLRLAQDGQWRTASALGDANAGGHGDGGLEDVEGTLGNAVAQPGGHASCIVVSAAWDGDEKLVAGAAPGDVVAAQITAEAAGQLAQDAVAAVVAVFAIDAREL